jgi:hypothetical protein
VPVRGGSRIETSYVLSKPDSAVRATSTDVIVYSYPALCTYPNECIIPSSYKYIEEVYFKSQSPLLTQRA